MDTNQIGTELLVERLHTTRRLACRAFLERAGSDWRLVTMIADGVDSEDTPGLAYDYEDVAFLKAVVRADELCAWLVSGEGELQGIRFEIPRSRVRPASFKFRAACA